MLEFHYRVAGEETVTRVPERPADFLEFREWVREAADSGRLVGMDTEGTGLNTYAPDFRLRCVQFGDTNVAWVIPVELGPQFLAEAEWALETLPRMVAHNAAFDALVLDRHTRVTLEDLWPRLTDTGILSRLHDPRQVHEGGHGHGLKPLSEVFVDPSAPDTAAGLYAEFRKIKKTKETGWRHIDVWNPVYLQYAGLDVILVSRLAPVLEALLTTKGISQDLVSFEHTVARICAQMERRGMCLDIEYTQGLSERLGKEETQYTEIARKYGIESVNAPKQVVAALQGMGEQWTEKTASGAPSTGKEVLLPMADLNRDWERIGARPPNPLAEAVLRAKRAGKWRSAYADNMLNMVDADGRIHPHINPLQARTARMSITNPALQTLPSGDWMIRRSMLADPGKRVIAVDYAAVEMRVLAALAPESVMIRAIEEGKDLHGYTAELVFGPDYTKGHRKISKAIGFGKVYGGGVTTITKQTGAPEAEVRNALKAYDRVYRGIRAYSRGLQNEAQRTGYVVKTVSGRILPLDRDRVYAATNYSVQSAARDVLAQALVDLDARGLGGHLLLPVHDEVVAQADEREAAEVAQEIGSVMEMTFFGVPLVTDPAVGGRSWGSLYMVRADGSPDTDLLTQHDPYYAQA